MSDNLDVKVVVVTGVESAGKSTLVNELSSHFNEPKVSEVARDYLNGRNGVYQYEDLEAIALQQLHNIQEGKKQATQYLFVDTALIVLKIWSEEKYQKCSNFILNQLANFKPFAYVLCDIDLPWEHDALREHPLLEDRKRLHKSYLAHLQESNAPFTIVAGKETERLKKVAQFLKELG